MTATVTTLQVNTSLLRLVLKHIEMHPNQWEQEVWQDPTAECGTTYCFAGWTIVLSGGRFVDTIPYKAIPPGADPNDKTQWRDIAEYACELLGLPFDNDTYYGYGHPLFHPDNTLNDLREMVTDLCEGREVHWP